MEVRLCDQKDIELLTDIFCEMSLFYLKENASSRATVRNNLENNILIERSAMTIFLGIDAGKAVGFSSVAVLYPGPQETAVLFIKEIFVSSAFQSRGVGRLLMKTLVEFAADNNCGRIEWAADSNNTSATEFYKKIGAIPMREKFYYRLPASDFKQFIAEL